MSGLPDFGCDLPKDDSAFRSQDAGMGQGPPVRVVHKNGELDRHLMTLPPGASVALEACGSWMWMAGRPCYRPAGHYRKSGWRRRRVGIRGGWFALVWRYGRMSLRCLRTGGSTR